VLRDRPGVKAGISDRLLPLREQVTFMGANGSPRETGTVYFRGRSKKTLGTRQEIAQKLNGCPL